MPFRPTFDCLWCGRAWRAADQADLTGWASLCPDCLERAQDNAFLRFRVRAALRERSGGATGTSRPSMSLPQLTAVPPQPVAPATTAVSAPPDAPAALPVTVEPTNMDAEMIAYFAAAVGESDDRYLRRGRYTRGAARDLGWHMELDQVTTWLDAQPLSGRIVELAAGTGWWSPLLAGTGELSLYDANPQPLDIARERLVAHRLRAHIHVRDAWAEPDSQVDALFCGFWLGHVPDGRLDAFLALVLRWLRPGGRFVFIDGLPDPEADAVDQAPSDADGIQERRLADGRRFRIVQVSRTPGILADALRRAGFESPEVTRTDRFFVMGSGVRPG